MSGLGAVNENRGLFLSVAGGYIWNRKADKDDPHYAEQEYTRADGTKGVRTGAQYGDLTGMVVGVRFRKHPEYGENINVTFDAEGERYVISISVGNRYCGDMMKALLNADLSKELYMKPYDFVGRDKKKATGISFRQGGEKLSLKYDSNMRKSEEWFKEASKKQIRRYFEDLADWYVAEVQEKVCSQFIGDDSKDEPKKVKAGLGAPSKVDEDESREEKISPIKMKKALRAYILENYPDQKLPKLSKTELEEWYQLSLEEEELPFESSVDESAEVSKSDLDAQLAALK